MDYPNKDSVSSVNQPVQIFWPKKQSQKLFLEAHRKVQKIIKNKANHLAIMDDFFSIFEVTEFEDEMYTEDEKINYDYLKRTGISEYFKLIRLMYLKSPNNSLLKQMWDTITDYDTELGNKISKYATKSKIIVNNTDNTVVLLSTIMFMLAKKYHYPVFTEMRMAIIDAL